MITSNLPPCGSENLGVADMIEFMRSQRPGDRAEILVGDSGRFGEWMERECGAIRKTGDEALLGAIGVPVVQHPYLQPNMAALLVNGEVRAIINLDVARRQ